MIKITFIQAVWIYLGFFLSLLIGIWLSHYLKNRKKIKISPLHKLYLCPFCHYPYLDLNQKKVSRCPNCHCFH